MSEQQGNGRTVREDAMAGEAAGVDPSDAPGAAHPAWLLRHRVELPGPIDGYLERPDIEARCALTDRRLTVLRAPGGFGKTALLARQCRALREEGTAAAWLALDEQDGPGALAAYLALAFEVAGLSSFDSGAKAGGADVAQPGSDRGADPHRCRGAVPRSGGRQPGRLPHQPAGERHRTPCRAVRAGAGRGRAAHRRRGREGAQRAARARSAQPAHRAGVSRGAPGAGHRDVRARRPRLHPDRA